MINTEEFSSNMDLGENNQPINVREIIFKYLYHWPVFVVGLLLCLMSGYIYLRYAEPVYKVYSILLIKDDKKGGPSPGGDLLTELDLFGGTKVIDNEIEILKSKTLMRKVVDRLNLSINYMAVGRIKTRDLYSGKPLTINIVNMDSTWYGKNLELSVTKGNFYLLKDKDSKLTAKGRIGELQRNHFGLYKINKTANSSKISGPITISINDPQVVTDHYLGLLSVDLASKQSTVLNLSLQSSVPEQGRDILNTLIQVYNEAALRDKNITTQSTIRFIDERLGLISGELTEVEKDVEGFKSSRGLTDLSSDADMFLESVKANDAKLSEINLQISVVNDVNRYVNSSLGKGKLPSTLGINDPVLLAQISQLGELQLKRDELLSTTTEDNPMVAPLLKQIETTRQGIKSSLLNISKALQVSKADLEGNNSIYQGSIKKIPGQERQLVSIKRQQSIKESLYLYLLQKKEEAALSYASAVADSRIVDPAFYSKSPIQPRRVVVLSTSLLLGLILPILYVYGKHILNDKVQGLSDIHALTSAPVLGEILFSEDSTPIVIDQNNRNAIAEQFRSIRTNMQFLHGRRITGKGTVTLFTSSISGEGKSFVSTNLAAALAISGRKTVLLELDLRKPKISKSLNLPNSYGLSNFLIAQVEKSQIIRDSGIHPNLYIISSGPVPPNPSELLVQEEMDKLITSLRNDFDEIIIDSPPIGLVTDAQILGRLADATIYMVRQGVTFKERVKSLEHLFKYNKLPKLNVILNGVTGSGSYGYGYGYGYYSDEVKKSLTFRSIIKRF
jgi:capsular exopolysaccharide synthesis family protein